MKALLFTVIGVITITSTAMADRTIAPGERVYADREYVSCEEGRSPSPWPEPPPPRRTRKVKVEVAANRSCLNAIPRTDGKATAKAANKCDDNNPERRALSGDCTLIDSQVDHSLAEDIISRSTTVIYDGQKDDVRDATAHKTYLCEILL